MRHPNFAYRAVVKPENPDRVRNLIAYRVPANGPFEAVIWSVPRKAWIYAPELAVRFVFDYKYHDKSRPVDRATAEQIAREILHAELPSVTTLEAMCEEGERMGWIAGPPRE